MKHFCTVSRKISFIGFWSAVIFKLMLLFSCREDSRMAKAQLGEKLFFDHRLSWNHSRSCASCHDPKFAFTDGYRRSVTPSGEIVSHNAPGLMNVSKFKVFDWSHPFISSLNEQLKRPLFAEHPLELGLHQHWPEFVKLLNSDSGYTSLWSKAFGATAQVDDTSKIIDCLIHYLNTLHSNASPYDRWMKGDSSSISASAQRGRQLFFSNRLNCSKCHGGPYFSNATLSSNPDSIFFNTGLYQHYPTNDQGLMATTKAPQDEGRFRVPSLRNVSLTGPYMHDGSISNLYEVMDLYSRGGRLLLSGPNAGDGAKHPNRHPLVNGFYLSATEQHDLIAFLETLTDSVIQSNQNHSQEE